MPTTQSPVYQLRLEYRQLDDQSVLEVPLGEADFARAVETAFFDGLRRGRFHDYVVPGRGVRIEPRFAAPDAASPLTSGFTVVLPADDGGEHRVDLGTEFLGSCVKGH